jgi:hypothetical protein
MTGNPYANVGGRSMDAEPKPGTVIVVETAVCRTCSEGIHRLAETYADKWKHNDGSVRCWAEARRRSEPVVVAPKEDYL